MTGWKILHIEEVKKAADGSNTTTEVVFASSDARLHLSRHAANSGLSIAEVGSLFVVEFDHGFVVRAVGLEGPYAALRVPETPGAAPAN